MKKFAFIIPILLIIVLFIVAYFIKKPNTTSNTNTLNSIYYNSTRVSSVNENSNNDVSSSNSTESNSNNSSNTDSANNENSSHEQYPEQNSSKAQSDQKAGQFTSNENSPQNSDSSQTTETPIRPKETELSSFTTKIYTKDTARQNNVSLTCSKLNGTQIQNGQTFSFCNTIGKATTAKGYQKADVFQDGEKIEALGGGNCQVSSTLYNAVLKLNDIKVTERHEHSNSVPYVAQGKDAAVAYGSYDFKFVNNTGNTIKIKSTCDKSYVYVKIFKLS